jgi:WD40 repeat protein
MNKFAPFLLLFGVMMDANAYSYLSTTSAANLGGLAFTSGDLVNLDRHTIEFHAAAFFDAATNLDDVARLGDGWLFSTSTDASIGGVPYRDGDLILLRQGAASLWMPESVFGTDEDIDALEIAPDGRVLLSTTSAAALAGLHFTSGDVVAYDRTADTASLWFRGADWFDATENIDALALLPDGSMLFSTSTDASIGGWAFRDGDVVRFDGSAFSLWLSEGIFSADEDIDALAYVVPEPGTGLLFSIGLAALARKRGRECLCNARQ